jgi:hypothetical protein
VALFAQKYDFKGVWHAAWKVVQQNICACEIEMKSVTQLYRNTLQTCQFFWESLSYRQIGKKLEKNDLKVLQEGIFVNSARTDSLVTSAT